MGEKMLAVWVWPDTVARLGAQPLCRMLSGAGVTDLYLLVKGQAGTACFDRCTLSPIACPGQDILPKTICAAHEKNIRVHAWLTTSHDAHFKEEHPSSGLCHCVRGRDRGIISLRNEEYLSYMRRFVHELFSVCHPDGLHLDYIRYNHLTYGWGEEDLRALSRLGADVHHLSLLMDKTFFSDHADGRTIFDAYEEGDPSVLMLADDRRRIVTSFAQALIEEARSVCPDAVASAALMPEGACLAGEMAGSLPGAAFAALHYGQSYQDAAKLYDHCAIMSYSCAYGKDAQWVTHLAKNAALMGLHVLSGIAAYGDATSRSLYDEMTATAKCTDENFLGQALFRAGEMVLCSEHISGKTCCITLRSMLDKPVDHIILSPLNGMNSTSCPLTLLPGEELSMTVQLPRRSYLLIRPFCGGEEKRALLVKEDSPCL